MAEPLPILRRFPALSGLPRAHLLAAPTRVDRVAIGDRELLIKRDDLCGDPVGGNKVRGLDWLLGDVQSGDEILTVGAMGSTHALTTALCGATRGARTTVVRWKQHMNDVAARVDARIRDTATVVDAGSVAAAYVIAFTRRLTSHARWIPAGGSTPRAILGHVNAMLELAEQIARGECVEPDAIVVPLGTGGTAAGLLLGARLAELRSRIVGVRVVPRIVGRAGRVARLANATARLIERVTGTAVPRVRASDLTIEHGMYGGAYGRPITRRYDESALAAAGIVLDDTYSRKAFTAAAGMRRLTLLWLTFDSRLLR